MRSSVLARIPGFRQRIIPEPHVPSRGSQARGTRLVGCWNAKGWDINWDESPVPSHANHVRFLVTCYVYQCVSLSMWSLHRGLQPNLQPNLNL
jgi:hypothetical protein